ncbi:MAG TPA: alpha/beta hydrolase [Clostridia bacterium]|nr:alpha/beta hydrolase [Clostridia bacterium]
MKIRNILVAILLLLNAACAWAGTETNLVTILKDLAYKSQNGISEYEKSRCKLDLYLPKGQGGFATLVWFHGGALQTGSKDDEFNVRIGQKLAQSGVAVAMVNYRLSPKGKFPSYVEDAAASFAWVRSHIGEHGGEPQKVFVGGHSAGGYLTFMIGLDGQYLRRYGFETTAIAGMIPVSGQTMTHYTIREERGLNKNVIIADEAAPIHHVRKDAPAMLVLYAEHDMAARVEENQYFVAALKAAGHTQVLQKLVPNRDHGSIAGNIPQPGDPVAAAILEFIANPETKAK